MLVLLRDTDNGGTCRRCAMQAECHTHRSGEGEYIPDGETVPCTDGPQGHNTYYALIEPTQDFDGAAVGAALATGSGV